MEIKLSPQAIIDGLTKMSEYELHEVGTAIECLPYNDRERIIKGIEGITSSKRVSELEEAIKAVGVLVEK